MLLTSSAVTDKETRSWKVRSYTLAITEGFGVNRRQRRFRKLLPRLGVPPLCWMVTGYLV